MDDLETALSAADPETPEEASEQTETLSIEEKYEALKAKYDADSAAWEKERQDSKAIQTGRLRAQERDDALHSRLDANQTAILRLNDNLAVIMEHLATGEGNPERLKQQAAQIRQDVVELNAKSEAASKWDDTYKEYLADAQKVLGDGKGGYALDPNGPELDDAVRVWNAANSAMDRVGMERALRLMERAVNEAKEKKTPPRRDRRADLEMAPSGPGASADKTQFTAAEIAAMSPEDYAKNRQHIVR
jgi:DNA repair exonuclease SbcCD ATPase subunit